MSVIRAPQPKIQPPIWVVLFWKISKIPLAIILLKYIIIAGFN